MRPVLRGAILVVAALALWPAVFVVLVTIDSVRGERLFLHQLAYDQRLLLESFIGDYVSAIPLVVAVLLAASAIAWLVSRRAGRRGAVASLVLAVPLLVVVLLGWRAGRFATPSAIATAATALPRESHFLLIGGGPKPSASEAQIEYNVNWVRESLRQLAPGAPVTTWFANGDGPAPTSMKQLSRLEEPDPQLDALATVYGEAIENRLRYRRHEVPDVRGPTKRDTLLPALKQYLESLGPGAQAMIVYNGHGTWSGDRADNAFRLWDETRLSVRDFERLLGATDSAVPVRFVLTQCYSGAFARAAHPDAEHSLELARGQRCGFFAESSERESEGCSASLALGDYRDYTTYFFAALAGKDRLGNAVPLAPDRDGDGVVTPFDAHLQTLAIGYNGDLPRSTSEEWLELWRPWASRWIGTGTMPDNLYGRLAREVARGAGLPEDGAELGAALTTSYDSLIAANEATLGERESLEQELDDLRGGLQERLERRWPELAHPYTASYRELVTRESAAIERIIRADSAYALLDRGQRRLEAIEVELVDLDRRISRLDRLRRTRMLARALDHLERTGEPGARSAYSRLRVCESLPLATR
jgi:hypothetical protein